MPCNSIYSLTHRDGILNRGGIVAKCHSTAGHKSMSPVLDTFGAKSTMPDEKFEAMVRGHFTFVSCFFLFCFIIFFSFCFGFLGGGWVFFFKECTTVKAII